MTDVDAISYGAILGCAAVVLGVWLRRAKPRQRRYVPVIPIDPVAEREVERLVRTQRVISEPGSGIKVTAISLTDAERRGLCTNGVRLPPPPVPTSADPWDEDEPTRLHGPEEKR